MVGRRGREGAELLDDGALRERAVERIALQARANLRNLISDDALALPSLSAIADDIRLELEKRGTVAILYVGLKRYGRLERVFGWRITSEILDACAGMLVNIARQGDRQPRRRAASAERRRPARPPARSGRTRSAATR